jgi:hypothetical protein
MIGFAVGAGPTAMVVGRDLLQRLIELIKMRVFADVRI